MAKPPSKSEYDFTFEDLEFDAVKQLAATSLAEELQVEETRCETLEKMFDFGKTLRADAGRMAAYFEAKGIKVNKTTRENPYNALVKMAFGEELGKAARSQYARTLHFAHVTRLNSPVGDWLRAAGIASRYAEAATHFAEPFKKHRGSARHVQMEAGKLAIDFQALSSAFQLTSPLEPGSYHLALLRVDNQGDQGVVRALLETTDKQLESIFYNRGNAREASHSVLADRPLFSLFRAISLVHSLILPSLPDVVIVIRDVSDRNGTSKTAVEVMSSALSFPWARVTIGWMAEFSGCGPLALTLTDAKYFIQGFQAAVDWTLSGDQAGGTLTAEHHKPIPLHPPTQNPPLFMGSALGPITRHVSLSAEAMNGVAALKAISDKHYSKGTRAASRKPWRFELDVNGKEITGASTEGFGAFKMLLFDTNRSTPISPDRSLSGATVEMICKALQPYEIDIAGHISDNAQVNDAEIRLTRNFDSDLLEIAIPFTISERGDLTPICEPFISTSARPALRPSSSGKAAKAAKIVSAAPKKKRRIPVNFPPSPYSSGNRFGAFITCFLPDDPIHRQSRLDDFEKQLNWWRQMTDIPVHVIASNWNDDGVEASIELGKVSDRGGKAHRLTAQPLIKNRIRSLEELYASEYDWGIVMDDDAMLMDSSEHNSGAAFFAEMAANAPEDYASVDIFFPIFGGKPNSQGPTWAKDPDLYAGNHVFHANQDLKGSMFVVRNFPKFDRPPVLPPAHFTGHGEDTLFAIEALVRGCSVMRCENIVLKELGGQSHYGGDRTAAMKAGNEAIAKIYGKLGLKMARPPKATHLLDRSALLKAVAANHPKELVVKKPTPPIERPW